MEHFTGCMVVNELNQTGDKTKYDSFFAALFTENYHSQPFKLLKFERNPICNAWSIVSIFPEKGKLQKKGKSMMDMLDEDNDQDDPFLINSFITGNKPRSIIVVTNRHTIIFDTDLVMTCVSRHYMFNEGKYFTKLSDET